MTWIANGNLTGEFRRRSSKVNPKFGGASFSGSSACRNTIALKLLLRNSAALAMETDGQRQIVNWLDVELR